MLHMQMNKKKKEFAELYGTEKHHKVKSDLRWYTSLVSILFLLDL